MVKLVYLTIPNCVKREDIKCMVTKVQSSNTLHVTDEVQLLKFMVATPKQQVDLLGFWWGMKGL